MTATYTLRTTVDWRRTVEQLATQFGRWGVEEWSLSPMREPRGKLHTRYGQRYGIYEQEERLVALYFRHPSGRDVRLSMERQERPVDNLRVLYLVVEAMRMNEVRGISDMLQAAYLQLGPGPAKEDVMSGDPYEVLGVRREADLEDIEAVYRNKAKRYHPDQGGSEALMKRINWAIEQIRKERE